MNETSGGMVSGPVRPEMRNLVYARVSLKPPWLSASHCNDKALEAVGKSGVVVKVGVVSHVVVVAVAISLAVRHRSCARGAAQR